MAFFDIFNENRLATTSVILGVLAIIIILVLPGFFNVFLYLGIPAIVTGVASLARLQKQRHSSHLPRILLAVAGIILGALSMIAIVWANR